jgi:serine protease Do
MRIKMIVPAAMLMLLLTMLSFNISFAQTADQRKSMQALSNLSDSFEALAEYVGPAIVQIFSTGYAPGDAQTTASIIAPEKSSGSGVILDTDGYIITNAHVVEDASTVRVLLPQKVEGNPKAGSIIRPRGKQLDAKIVGVDRETDLAVIKIEEQNLPYLELGDSDYLRQGEVVLTFGSPLGLENSVTMGVVSSVARQLRPEDPMIYIQTDAPINPGNSGGPLVDTKGKVVGINTFILSQSGGSEGLGFAAPGNIVKNVYEQIKKYGRVRRGIIGVNAQTIIPEMAVGLKLPRDWGVIIGDIFPGSPAAQSGLKIGDIIFSMDNKIMENGRQFDVNLYRRNIGDNVKLEIIRGSERLNISVKVIERDDDPFRFIDMVNPAENLVPRLGILGIDLNSRIEEMLPRLRKKFGVLVAAISGETPAIDDMLYPGDVLYAVNGTEITGLYSLRTELEKYKTGDAVVLQLQRQGKLMFLALVLEQ